MVKRIEDYYFEVYVWNDDYWNLVKSKLIREIKSGKINSPHLLDKAFYKTVLSIEPSTDSFFGDHHFKNTAFHYILLAEIDYFLKDTGFDVNKKDFITKVLIHCFRDNPLCFSKVSDKFSELSQIDDFPENIKDEYVNFIPEYNHHDLKEVVMVEPICDEFIDLLYNLNLDLFRQYEIRCDIKKGCSALKAIHNAYMNDVKISNHPSKPDDLKSWAKRYFHKAILYFEQNRWHEIFSVLESEIDDGIIKSQLDLKNEFEKIIDVDDKTRIKGDLLYAQIEVFLDFRELEKRKFFKDLAYMVRSDDILDYNIVDCYHQLADLKGIHQKIFLDDGKFPAPRWMAYPDVPGNSRYWSQYYQPAYYFNSISDNLEIFPKPKEFQYNPDELYDYEKIPFRLMPWNPDGKPKYSRIDDDYEIVNRFITLDQYDNPVSYEGIEFYTIKQALTACKVSYFDKFIFTKKQVNTLIDYEYSDEEELKWDEFKYTVCLNATYIKFMSDKYLRDRLLETGNKPLVYISDDEWGCNSKIQGENLFVFALMEVRDELQRLFSNEELIDWQYTEYLKNNDFFTTGLHRSAYQEYCMTYHNLKAYVRDVNMEVEFPFEAGDIIVEDAKINASSKIGGMLTSHRIVILSNHMDDLVSGASWNAYTTWFKALFKVLDIYDFEGKTQILLLHLYSGHYFEDEYECDEEIVKLSRKTFENVLKLPPIVELIDDEWMELSNFNPDDCVYWRE